MLSIFFFWSIFSILLSLQLLLLLQDGSLLAATINGFPLSTAKITEKRKIIEEIALADVKKVRHYFSHHRSSFVTILLYLYSVKLGDSELFWFRAKLFTIARLFKLSSRSLSPSLTVLFTSSLTYDFSITILKIGSPLELSWVVPYQDVLCIILISQEKNLCFEIGYSNQWWFHFEHWIQYGFYQCWL